MSQPPTWDPQNRPEPQYGQQYGPPYGPQWGGAPPAGPWSPGASGDRAAGRPGLGGLVAALGAVLVALGLFALDWVKDADFGDVHDAVDARQGAFDVITQVYALYAVYPLFALVVVAAVCACVGPLGARFGVGVLALLSGAALVGLVIWVEAGGAGSDDSRSDALPLILAIGIGGAVVIALGIVAMVEKRGVVGRFLVGVLAAGVIVVHSAVLSDLFDGPPEASIGAWLPLVGYSLVLVGVALPYRSGRPTLRQSSAANAHRPAAR